ncbi:MAG: aminotransferase DegT [Deltaproteobacteria bacterium]|nr:MAG: aminotransferase DegT [Deltaproteobacteria bacterium]
MGGKRREASGPVPAQPQIPSRDRDLEEIAPGRHQDSRSEDRQEHPLRIRRTIPPTAAPISPTELLHGFRGIVDGSLANRLEREIREHFGTEHVFLASSGKAALFLILSGLKRMSRRRKVILPAYTCFSVPSAVRMAGLEIVLCDIRPETLDFDYPELAELADHDTLCVIPTHLFGIPSDIAKVREICGRRGIYILEDAAQAMGVESPQGKPGTLGDVAFFSLGRGKTLTCGSGGIILTTDADIAESIRECASESSRVSIVEYLKDIMESVFLAIFLHPSLYWFPKLLPFLKIGETRFCRTFPVHPLTGFKAGLLHDWRAKMELHNRSRSRNAAYYMDALGLAGRMPIYSADRSFLRFPVYAGDKRSKKELCELGDLLGISPMYPSSINNIPEIRDDFHGTACPGAERIAETLVTLPTHAFLEDRDRTAVREAVTDRFRDPRNADCAVTRNASSAC